MRRRITARGGLPAQALPARRGSEACLAEASRSPRKSRLWLARQRTGAAANYGTWPVRADVVM